MRVGGVGGLPGDPGGLILGPRALGDQIFEPQTQGSPGEPWAKIQFLLKFNFLVINALNKKRKKKLTHEIQMKLKRN